MALQRAAAYGYHVVDDLHGLLDDVRPYQPQAPAAGLRKFLVSGMIVSGVLLSTINKVVYEIQAPGKDGVVHNFEKPWFMVLIMFMAMSACLPLSLALDLLRALACSKGTRNQRQQQQQQQYKPLGVISDSFQEPLLEGEQLEAPQLYEAPEPQMFAQGAPSSAPSTAVRRRWWLLERKVWLLVLPAGFDLGTSALMNIGLVFITASAAQMLRQSLMLFAALLARWWLAKPLNRYHCVGLLGCTVGLCLVSAAVIGSGYGGNGPRDQVTHASMALGVLLLLLSQLLQAIQLVVDPGCHQRVHLSPLKVVGAEGLMGVALTALVALPLLSVGRGVEGEGLREDTLDTLAMVRSSLALQALLLVQLGAVQAYNICGMAIAGDLDTVSTTLLQALRTVFVWIVCLLLRVSPLGSSNTSSALPGDGALPLTPGSTLPVGHAGLLQPPSHLGHTLPHLLPAAAAAATSVMPGNSTCSGCWQSLSNATMDAVAALQQQQQQQHMLASAAASALLPQQQQQQVRGQVLGWLLGLWQQLAADTPLAAAGAAGEMQLGEPWGAWSLLQGLGFAIMVLGTVLYSRGDTHQSEYQMLSEATLLLLGGPAPIRPRPESLAYGGSLRHFTANMDFDAGSVVRGFARSPVPAPTLSPGPSTPRAPSLPVAVGRQGSGRISGDGCRGIQVVPSSLDAPVSLTWRASDTSV